MLNINNLNRVRRVLSAQDGAKAPSTSNMRIKYLGRFGDGYKYATSPIAVEDWSQEYSDLPPEEYYKQKAGNANFDNLEYAEGLDPSNINQQSYQAISKQPTTEGNTTYYGITSSGDKQNLSQSEYNYFKDRGIGNKTEKLQTSKSTSLPNTSKSEQTEDVFQGPFMEKTERFDLPKEQQKKLEREQSVSNEQMAKSADPSPSNNQNGQSVSQTLQSKTPINNPSVITLEEPEKVNIPGTPSGQATTTEEQPKKSESFLKGEATGKEIGEKIGNFLKSDGVQKAGEYGEKAGVIADAVDGMIRSGNDWAPQTGFENTWDQASTIAMKFGPLGKAIGGGMKVAKVVSDLFGSKTQDFAKDTSTLETVGGSYGGSSALIEDAANKAGKKYGLFASGAKRRANRLIDRARIQQYAMQGIADDARDLNSMRSYMDPYYLQYQSDISGGYDQRYMHVAKLGGTLTLNNTFPVKQYIHINKDYTPNFYKSGGTLQTDTWFPIINESEVYWDPIITFETPSFKSGGTIKEPEIEVIEVDTTQKSVIPEGALHKNKHNLDQVGVDDSELTKKGIPVVDNQGDQQAEIELNEIIFTLEVTKELEKRYKEYYKEETKQSRKDELAIEAGKLLWKEILYNTDDRTGLINTLKKGGSIPSKSTVERDTTYVASPIQEFKPFVLPEFKTFVELKKYLKQTGRDSEEDYNLKAAYEDPEVYKIWREEEQKHPGSGHWLDKYKKPNHPTFSTESIYSNLQTPGGEWVESEDGKVYFIPSGYLKSLYSKEFYNEYFKNNPKVTVIYSKKTTQKKKHQFGGVLQQEDVTIMVKQALIDLFSKL